ncbi:Uncharacterised protein [Campylobacter insulaenigrae]|uniref:DUF4145 domain-containing protein n=1 Tax=Campylobacter insulaenigrae TaxID=260714 RepID=UPI000F6EA9ED|nr:DUF4145 domain-containing protein [Campylobacter insulaenigrae]MCR6591149.1 DUF4145 domain-containing protein [Campylobacter insulaenigrae]MCR6593110.1 DUF4145 domain-containing protein [Campylobacter insulaenigrae]VEJ55221.1 Uncharacterised protein [Campylobacter insulaenigrae]
MNNLYEKPEISKDAFNCPFCGVYTKMDFLNFSSSASKIYDGIGKIKYTYSISSDLEFEKIESIIDFYSRVVPILSICHKCNKTTIWIDGKMIYPKPRLTPMPNEDLDENLKLDYEEASNIVQDSPRSACALLRLVLQKLLINLGEDKNINNAIKNLIDKKEIDEKLQKALDSVRVIGNNAVHPNELDLKDDIDIALSMFRIINYIADRMISSKKEIDEIYNILPENAKR